MAADPFPPPQPGPNDPSPYGGQTPPPPGGNLPPTPYPGNVFPGNPAAAGMPPVPNYLVQAILATLCCCLPLGIVSIVFAAQVNGKLQAGDYAGAVQASKNAKLWAWIALGGGLLVGVIYVALVMLGVAGSMLQSTGQ